MIRRDVIHDALNKLGISGNSAEHIARVLFVIQVDHFLAGRRARSEEVISVLVENALMYPCRLESFEAVMESIEALKEHLSSLRFMYTVMPAEIDLSSHIESANRMISREFAWA